METQQWLDMSPFPTQEQLDASNSPIVVDTETLGKTDESNIVFYYSWAADDMPAGAGTLFTDTGNEFFQKLISCKRPKICHSISADIGFCLKTGFELLGPYEDTLCMHYLIDEYDPDHHALKPLSRRLLGRDRFDETLLHDEQKKYPDNCCNLYVPQKLQHIYATADAQDELDCFHMFGTMIKEMELWPLYRNEVDVALVFWKMQQRGQGIANDLIDATVEQLKQPLVELLDKMQELWQRKFNPNSPAQLAKVLTECANIPLTTLTDKGALSTNKDELRKFRHQPGMPFLLAWKRLNTCATMLKGYRKEIKADGRLHSRWHPDTIPGRTASSSPNLMSIPKLATNVTEIEIGDVALAEQCSEAMKVVRQVFVAAEGGWLVSQDYGQGEYRCFAHYTRAQRIIKWLCEGKEDFHTIICKLVFGEETEALRVIIKIINFGVLYGMQEASVIEILEPYCGRSKAEQALRQLERNLPEMREFQERLKRTYNELGYVRDVFGRYYRKEPPKPNAWGGMDSRDYICVAHLCAGTLANIKKISLVRIDEILSGCARSDTRKAFIHKRRSGIQLDVHDDIVIELFPEDAQLLPHIKKAMINFPQLDVPLISDISIGKNLLSMKKFKGPEAMERAVAYLSSSGKDSDVSRH